MKPSELKKQKEKEKERVTGRSANIRFDFDVRDDRPPAYKKGMGPPLAPICPFLPDDKPDVVIKQKFVENEVPFYIVGHLQDPADRRRIGAARILDYVSRLHYENYEYELREGKEDVFESIEEAPAKVSKKPRIDSRTKSISRLSEVEDNENYILAVVVPSAFIPMASNPSRRKTRSQSLASPTEDISMDVVTPSVPILKTSASRRKTRSQSVASPVEENAISLNGPSTRIQMRSNFSPRKTRSQSEASPVDDDAMDLDIPSASLPETNDSHSRRKTLSQSVASPIEENDMPIPAAPIQVSINPTREIRSKSMASSSSGMFVDQEKSPEPARTNAGVVASLSNSVKANSHKQKRRMGNTPFLLDSSDESDWHLPSKSLRPDVAVTTTNRNRSQRSSIANTIKPSIFNAVPHVSSSTNRDLQSSSPSSLEASKSADKADEKQSPETMSAPKRKRKQRSIKSLDRKGARKTKMQKVESLSDAEDDDGDTSGDLDPIDELLDHEDRNEPNNIVIRFFLVKWKDGEIPFEPSWEPETNVLETDIKDYFEKKNKTSEPAADEPEKSESSKKSDDEEHLGGFEKAKKAHFENHIVAKPRKKKSGHKAVVNKLSDHKESRLISDDEEDEDHAPIKSTSSKILRRRKPVVVSSDEDSGIPEGSLTSAANGTDSRTQNKPEAHTSTTDRTEPNNDAHDKDKMESEPEIVQMPGPKTSEVLLHRPNEADAETASESDPASQIQREQEQYSTSARKRSTSRRPSSNALPDRRSMEEIRFMANPLSSKPKKPSASSKHSINDKTKVLAKGLSQMDNSPIEHPVSLGERRPREEIRAMARILGLSASSNTPSTVPDIESSDSEL